MNRRAALILFATAPLAALAQTGEMGLDELLGLGRKLLEENVDPEVLRQLGEVDDEKVRALLQQLQTQFAGDSVLDLAALKEVARTGLKLLEANEATRPYADWLRPRLDYFDVAEALDQATPPPKPPAAGQPAPPKPPPSPALEKKAWAKVVSQRPRPTSAAALEPRLKPIFRRHGLPAELFWLAEVESGFNATARSPVGAVGLYQLMPATAKSLGLSLFPFDQRKDPERSAEAAARYLRSLYGRFTDWPLALAAYNAGEGRVGGILKQRQAKSFDAIAARLPAETQLYVPKFNAVLRQREGVALADLPRPKPL